MFNLSAPANDIPNFQQESLENDEVLPMQE